MSPSNTIDVILVEDEPDLRDILVSSLSYFGLVIRGVGNAAELDREFMNKPADILLLDLNLPGEGGNAIALRYRKAFPGIGIVMLTARGDRDSRVLGYSDGADQYFVKPVDHEELAIALKNLARRMGAKQACWIVDVGRRKLMAPNGFQTDLSHNETMILGTLARENASVVKRSVLYQVTNNSDDAFAAQRLETALSRLRSKLKQAGMPDLPVKASHGAGYVFVDPVRVLGEG